MSNEQMRRRDGWISNDGGLSWRHPAPNAEVPLVPTGETVTVKIGGGSAVGVANPVPHEAVKALIAIREIQVYLESIMKNSVAVGNTYVETYKVPAEYLHRLVSTLSLAGFPVNVPVKPIFKESK